MANSDKDILITPNTGSSTADPKIEYVGADSSANDTITVETQFDGSKSTLSFEGSAGQLFSVSNDLSGTLFAVNDSSGIPSIEVDSDGEIRLAEFSGNVGIGISAPTELLHVDGRIKANNLTLASLSAQNSEATAVMIDGSGIIGTRELGSNAFNSTSYLTGNQTITLSGDASGSGTTSIAVTIADDSHNHIISNVDGLQTALDAKAPVSTTVTTNGTQSISGAKTFTTTLALSSGQKLTLKDANHYVQYLSTGFSGSTIDGPVVVGHQGGELGTNISSNQYSLRWDSAGNIIARNDGYFNGTKLEGDNKEMIRYSDSWLRLNPANEFTSGIYLGSGIIRTDGQFQVGSSGSQFKIESNGNTTVNGTVNLNERVNIGDSLTRPAALNSDSAAHLKVGASDVHLYVASLNSTGGYKVAVQAARDSDFASFTLNLQSNGGALQRGGNTVWDAGNDGPSSGLNADLLDDQHGSYYLDYNNFTNKPTIPTNNNQLTNGAGYVTASTTSLSNYMRLNASADVTNYSHVHTFYTNGNMASTSGSQSSLQCYNGTVGNDAFMTFHVGSDFACYFGLDGGTNKLSVGGWSMGANSYEIYHAGNKPSLATLGFTGDSNANYITNNNQLTNGAGYITSFDITTQTDSKYLRSNAADTASGQITFNSGGIFATNGVRLYRQNTNSTIWFNGSSAADTNHALWNGYYGNSPTTRGSANTGFDGIYWNTYRGIHIRGGLAGAVDCIKVTNSSASATDHSVTLYASNVARLATNTTGVDVTGRTTTDGLTSAGSIIVSGASPTIVSRGADSEMVFQSTNESAGNPQQFFIQHNLGNVELGNSRGYNRVTAGNWNVNNGICAGGIFNAVQGVLQVKGDQTMNRGSFIRWANDGGGTGEYIYSKSSSPYDVTIHSGSYDALQCPNTGSVRINHNGSQKFVSSSSGVSITGTLTASADVVAYSDEKLKDNVQVIENAIEKVKQIRGVTFTRNDLEDTEKRHTGVIAQEVEKVLPEVVNYEMGEFGLTEIKTVSYGNMVGLLIEAIKEQQETIEKLTSRINDMEKGE